jgi:hypothetical protein
MGATVFANGMSIACKVSSGKTTAAMPDVCLSPPSPPAGPIPIPYPNTASASDTDKGSKTVEIGGQPVMLKDSSEFKTSTGNEAATRNLGMGVVTHKIQGVATFVAWSMDVKFEGENVPRHMDLMGHNEACNDPTSTPPWPFLDSASLADSNHPCVKSKDAENVKKECGSGKPEDCFEPECCKARKCVMVPFSPNKCCSNEKGVQKTPHHPIPFQDHYLAGARKLAKALRPAKLLPGAGQYDGDAAPCICLEGHDHGAPDSENPPRHEQHGRCGRAFAALRKRLAGDTYKYSQVSAPTAQIVGHVAVCDKDCIKAQMDEYHITRAGATGDLRKSQQAAVGGEDYLKEAIPPASDLPSIVE